MKKFYSFLAALALTTPAFATVFTDNDMVGEWTFTVYDYTDGPSTTPVKLVLTATADSDEGHFALPDNMGNLYIGAYGTVDDEPGLIYFRLDAESPNKVGSDTFLSESQPYYIDGDVVNSAIYCFYNPETKKVEKFKRYNTYFKRYYDLEQVGFKVYTYETRDQLLTSHNFVVQSIQRGVVEDSDTPVITISLPDEAIKTGYSSATAANFTATPTVTAENVDDFEVHYSVELWDEIYVQDTIVEEHDGDTYTIFVDNLDYAGFGKNYYNLKVWAEAREYKSAVVTQEVAIDEAPTLRVIASSLSANITDTSADIAVTVVADNIEGDLTYTISATSDNGPAVDPITGTSGTATFNITGLTPGTEYTYTVKAEANYANRFTTLEETANVIFTTATAPAVTLEGNASAQNDEMQNTDPDNPMLDEPEEWTVSASFNEVTNELAISNFDNSGNPITFTVNLTTGDAFAANQGFNDEDYFELYGPTYYGNKDFQLQVTAKVMNYGDNQTRVVVDPWGEMIYIGDMGYEWFFNVFYYNTDIILDGTIPGLQYNGPSVTVDNVRWVAQEDNADGSSTDFFVTVATEGLADDAEVTVYYKGPGDNDFNVAEKIGDEYTFTLSRLKGETEYTVTVYAASGLYTSDEVVVSFATNTGVDNVIAGSADAVRYYNLQGIEVTHPAVGNAYIKVEGTKATKVVVK